MIIVIHRTRHFDMPLRQSVTSSKCHFFKVSLCHIGHFLQPKKASFRQETSLCQKKFDFAKKKSSSKSVTKCRFFGEVTFRPSDAFSDAEKKWSLWRAVASAKWGFGKETCLRDALLAKWPSLYTKF